MEDSWKLPKKIPDEGKGENASKYSEFAEDLHPDGESRTAWSNEKIRDPPKGPSTRRRWFASSPELLSRVVLNVLHHQANLGLSIYSSLRFARPRILFYVLFCFFYDSMLEPVAPPRALYLVPTYTPCFHLALVLGREIQDLFVVQFSLDVNLVYAWFASNWGPTKNERGIRWKRRRESSRSRLVAAAARDLPLLRRRNEREEPRGPRRIRKGAANENVECARRRSGRAPTVHTRGV